MKRTWMALRLTMAPLLFLIAVNACLADWQEQHRLPPDPHSYVPACLTDASRNPRSINDMWASDAGILVAVGSSGVILHHDATGWHDLSVETDVFFTDVWGASETEFFAVGYSGSGLAPRGVIYHYRGDRWSREHCATYAVLNSVWGASADRVFAVGEKGAIVQYNGQVWAPMASKTNASLVYVNGASATDLFAMGELGSMYHCDGQSWTNLTEGSMIWIDPTDYGSAVWGDSVHNVYVCYPDKIMHFDGDQWKRLVGVWDDYRYFIIGAFGSDCFVVARDCDGHQTLFIHQPSGWQAHGFPEGFVAYRIAGTRADDIYMFGDMPTNEYRFFRYDGTAWTPIGDNRPRNVLRGVWGVGGSDVFAVGDGGLIYHYDGSGWQPMSGVTAADLKDVWGHQASSMIAVGGGGTVLRYDGGHWQQIASNTDRDLNAVRGDSAGNVYIVGDGGTLLHFDGQACTPLASGTDADLNALWVSETGIVYVVGMRAVFLVVDRETVSPVEDLPLETPDIYGIWGSSPTDLYASVSVERSKPNIYHYDGSTWELAYRDDVRNGGTKIWGRSAADIYAVSNETGSGVSDEIYHFDGTRWSAINPEANTGWMDGNLSNTNWHDVWATESGVFIVGDHATILHEAWPDDTAPTILAVYPENGATVVGSKSGGYNLRVEILFSEPVRGTPVDGTLGEPVAVSIADGSGKTQVPYMYSFESGGSYLVGWIMTEPNTTYTLTVAADTTDFSGNAMGTDYNWSFTIVGNEDDPEPAVTGVSITDTLWLGALINTGDQGEIEGRWQLGGEDTTARGDRVIWGYFYADPADVSWGDPDNPDLFVKIWFDVTGSLYISYFHVSVPEIRIASQYPEAEMSGATLMESTATLSRRHVGHFYYFRPQNGDFIRSSTYQLENGLPVEDDDPAGNPAGYALVGGLRIGAVINTEDKGPLEGLWTLGGQATTQRGDQVLWGYFYADPDVMNWGSRQNPDCFVKAWYDVSGAVFLDFFHVSVPDIEVFSAFSASTGYENRATTILDNRFIEHRYRWD